MPTLGKIIRNAREKLGWSQARLAREVGVSRAAVGQWENDETAPTRKHAPAVARVLAVPLGAIDPRQPQGVIKLDSTTVGRTIPIIMWGGIMLRGRARGEDGVVSVDPDTPNDAVAMRVIDDAMSPEICSGDMIIVSGSMSAILNDIVIANIGDGQPIMRRYVPRGMDRFGKLVFDLLSTAPDWPTITCNSANGGNVLAVVVSHTRKLRRT